MVAPATVMASVRWDRYEEEVLLAVEDAVQHYLAGRKGSEREPVCQLSVWTVPETQVTAVGFETVRHALQRGGFFPRQPADGAPRQPERVGHVYPSEFAFRAYHCVCHPALEPFLALDFRRESHKTAALQHIEASLLRVMNHVRSSNILRALPHEDPFWIGINSPRDWYDHVTAL